MSDNYYFEEENTLESPSSSQSTQDKSSSLSSLEESSPHFAQLSDICDIEALSQDTKKIKKKRCAYDKIDDEKSIQLLIAVHKNGESLKAASNRLKINYSSAKSILHTFRKEGRILKKSPLEIGARPSSACNLPLLDIDPSLLGNDARRLAHRLPSQGTITSNIASFPGNDTECPMRSLTSIFENLGLEDDSAEEPSFIDLLLSTGHSESKFQIPTLDVVKIEGIQIPSFTAIDHDMNELPVLRKKQSSFYMKYSDSPLSAGKVVLFRECSNPGTTQRYTREFDSFGELVTAFQMGHNHQETQGDHHMPSLCRTDSIENFELANFIPMVDPDWLLYHMQPSLLEGFIQVPASGSVMTEGDNANNQEIKA